VVVIRRYDSQFSIASYERSRTDYVRYRPTRWMLIEERLRSYGDQVGLTMKLTSSVQSTVESQGFVPSPSLAI
jgi:hypothetical protein